MRLLLPIPAGWEERNAPGRQRYVLPHAPNLTVEVGPMLLRDDVPDDLLQRGLRPGERLQVLAAIQHSTHHGWELQLSQALVLDGSGAPCEFRMVARYSVLIYAAAVMVRAPSPAVYEACAAEIIATLEAAQPELRSDRPAAISELFEMEEAK